MYALGMVIAHGVADSPTRDVGAMMDLMREVVEDELPRQADYDRIQDPAGKIPDEEPVFLIRGQDWIGPAVVEVWATMAGALGADPAPAVTLRDLAFEAVSNSFQAHVQSMAEVFMGATGSDAALLEDGFKQHTVAFNAGLLRALKAHAIMKKIIRSVPDETWNMP